MISCLVSRRAGADEIISLVTRVVTQRSRTAGGKSSSMT